MMARQNRNKYAALAAARRGDWAAVMRSDNLDLLDERMLTDVFNATRQHPRSENRDMAMDALRDELKRREIDAAHALEMRQ